MDRGIQKAVTKRKNVETTLLLMWETDVAFL